MVFLTRRMGHWRSRAVKRPAIILLALTILLSGLLGAVPTPQARAQATPATVTVRLTIDSVTAIDGFEGGGSADFFPKVHLNGGPEEKRDPVVDDDDVNPAPADWHFETDVNIDTAIAPNIPITIEIFDADGFLRFDDDKADITPVTNRKTLALNVNVGAGPCAISGDVSGLCDASITAVGDAVSDNAKIVFHVNVLSTLSNSDADGDAIPDSWEQNGVTIAGQFIDLPAMGADPNKPDIFLQIDWMQNSTNDQRLTTTALKQVADAFAASPYTSPTGSKGITMHIDEDANSVNFPTTLAKAQKITLTNNLGALDSAGNYSWTAVENIKMTNFYPTGRALIFHYVIAAFLQEPPPPGGTQNTSSGISRNPVGPKFFDGGSDLLITLGGFSGTGAGTDLQQAGTLMHELGHNLGLAHGGNDGNNYEPNYLSIMNYAFQLVGLDGSGNPGAPIDYSRSVLPPLDEAKLDQSNGLSGATAGQTTATACKPGTATTNPTLSYFPADGPVDWDCNPATTGVISFDANGDGKNNTDLTASGGSDLQLTGFNDWLAIKFNGGLVGGFGVSTLPASSPVEPEITTTPPTVDAGGPYQVGEGASVVVSASASDPEGGPLTYAWDLDNNGSFETPGQSVTFSAAALSAPSSHTIKVQVTDNTNLKAVDEAIVTVIYNFSGFFQPVDNLPVFNSVKAGSSIPVKFSLSGDQGLDIFAAGYPKSQVITCDSTAPVDGVEETVAAGSSSLSYDASTDQYSYVWKTDKAWAGTCRQLVVKLNDGTSHRANFQLTK